MRGRERGAPIREEHRRREGERRERLKREHYNQQEGGGGPHGRLTGIHVRDLADVPRGQVLVEGGGIVKH